MSLTLAKFCVNASTRNCTRSGITSKDEARKESAMIATTRETWSYRTFLQLLENLYMSHNFNLYFQVTQEQDTRKPDIVAIKEHLNCETAFELKIPRPFFQSLIVNGMRSPKTAMTFITRVTQITKHEEVLGNE